MDQAGRALDRPRPSVSSADDSPTRAARWTTVLRQLLVFACVGGAFNVVYALLFVLLRQGLDAQPANAVALILSTIAGTWGHRRMTFGVRGSEGTVGHQTLGLALLVFSLALTAGSLWLLDSSVASPSRRQELLVLVAANLGTGLVRFTAFRVAMVAHPERRPAPLPIRNSVH
jgi:putative flippase GtrA